jgi:colicin import membrane protein
MIPGGTVTSVEVVQSSGDPSFDRSAVAAVQRASPLPVSADPEVMDRFRSFNFRFNPGG